MERLRIFLSSTCFDLKKERTILQKLLTQQGHIPILSDKSNIRYDPDKSTHDMCLHTVERGTDYLIMVISSRFGGAIFREAFIKHINVTKLRDKSKYKQYFQNKKYSISQCEALKALELGIPCLIFVHKKISDKRNEYNNALKTGSKKKIAMFHKTPDLLAIFDFITFVNNLYTGNGTYEFSHMTQVKQIILESLSDHFRNLLTEQKQNKITYYPQCISADQALLNSIVYSQLQEDYQKQKAIITVDNKLIFDENYNCEYYLNVKIRPITDCPLYCIQLVPDKMGQLNIKKFINVDNHFDSSYVVFRKEKSYHLFLFNRSKNLKAQFNVVLNASIENHISDLNEEGKTNLVKSVIGKNVNYNYIVQQMYFPVKSYKDLKVVYKQHPDEKKIDIALKPVKKTLNSKRYFFYTFKVKREILNKRASPTVRLELSK